MQPRCVNRKRKEPTSGWVQACDNSCLQWSCNFLKPAKYIQTLTSVSTYTDLSFYIHRPLFLHTLTSLSTYTDLSFYIHWPLFRHLISLQSHSCWHPHEKFVHVLFSDWAREFLWTVYASNSKLKRWVTLQYVLLDTCSFSSFAENTQHTMAKVHSCFSFLSVQCKFLHKLYNKHLHIKGFRPEWCISTIYHAWDTPFWSETLDMHACNYAHN